MVHELRQHENNRQTALDDAHTRINSLREQISTAMKEIMELMAEQDKQ